MIFVPVLYLLSRHSEFLLEYEKFLRGRAAEEEKEIREKWRVVIQATTEHLQHSTTNKDKKHTDIQPHFFLSFLPPTQPAPRSYHLNNTAIARAAPHISPASSQRTT